MSLLSEETIANSLYLRAVQMAEDRWVEQSMPLAFWKDKDKFSDLVVAIFDSLKKARNECLKSKQS